MASGKRTLLEPTDDWQQLRFRLDWTEQTRYELIRPVVVFGAPEAIVGDGGSIFKAKRAMAIYAAIGV